MANRPSYKQKFEEATQVIEALKQRLDALESTPQPQAQGQVSVKGSSQPARVKKVGTATQIVLFNRETGAPAQSLEDAITIRPRAGTRNVNFLTVTEEGESAKPIEELRTLIHRTNSQVQRHGFAPSTKHWYMDEQKFYVFIKEWNAQVKQVHIDVE